ncbi:MAG: type I-F CRISPR-associated helicase Cas3, partial [Gammaproteobacteria bacterium]|nr:type I-F CRISPR-associated helicase Cas3 [Gammaproteobacteria bacterium]
MIVTFISQCEKKATIRTRQVLDAFAQRIGDNTWQTIITQDGLNAVKSLLKKSATKNTSVSCHWVRGRSHVELIWIVGARNKFNDQGFVPVNSTSKNLSKNHWENDWEYLPLIKALVAISALLHDWGKASVLFQNKLRKKEKRRESDPVRHEWVSCEILNALISRSSEKSNDESWLNVLIEGNWNETDLKKEIKDLSLKKGMLSELPPLAQLVAWLIVSHHRLPIKDDRSYKDKFMDNMLSNILKIIDREWGYSTQSNKDNIPKCFEFKEGLLSQSDQWMKSLQKWAGRLLKEKRLAEQALQNGAWRVILHHARLALMLGDHYYSSCEKDLHWKNKLNLIANTDIQGQPKQYLDEHLVHVSQNALTVAQSLSRLESDMQYAYDIQALKKTSQVGFEWQDRAVKSITQFSSDNSGSKERGWFIVNMASTGKGKTIANAKIMQSLSHEGNAVRYILALGLRTLTLQTGDAYRKDLGLDRNELAVLIGSKAYQELHEQKTKQSQDTPTYYGSESNEDLLDDQLEFDDSFTPDFMNVLFPANKAQRNKAFLYTPVLVCTIDHIMAATETTRGGKYILPCLRLLSSDLVIDEVDDFDQKDLIAIARLVHLVGMLGRKVMISSATIPPDLAKGLFNAYQSGWKLYCAFKNITLTKISTMWVDEFGSSIQLQEVNENQTYNKNHDDFIKKRCTQLLYQPVKHAPEYVSCSSIVNESSDSLEKKYSDCIKNQIEKFHQYHHTIDKITGKRVSFGVVRIANVQTCIRIARYLMNAEWSKDV